VAADAPAAILSLDDPRWTDFVAAAPDATPFHHPAWTQILARTYGYKGFAVAVCDRGGALVAGAPFLEVRTPLRRRRWISLPFTDECPPLATDAAGGRDLVRALSQIPDAAPFEVRGTVDALSWHAGADAVVHVLELGEAAEVYKRFSKSQVRRNISRAEREGITVREGVSAADVDAFLALHTRTRRRQGVPVQPRRFFDELRALMLVPGLGSIVLAYDGETPIAGALFLAWNGTTIYKFGASDPEGWPKRPNHAIFWHAIQASCARGDARFDFGRTDLDNPGLRAFKSGWGAAERPLVYSSLQPQAVDGHAGVGGRVMAAAIQRGPDWVCRGLGATLYRYAASR
jgi:CelD/BcsL family acetyltransferase involved in cellulose biosynthesis